MSVHDHRLAPMLVELLADDSREDVQRTIWCPRAYRTEIDAKSRTI